MTQGIGIGLSQRFLEQVAEPIIQDHFPQLAYAACRIGIGSEVFGYDTEMSADHDYGPCVQIILPESAFPTTAEHIMGVLDRELPERFEGWTVRYPTHVRPSAAHVGEGGLGSDHGVELWTLPFWCTHFLGRQFATEPAVHEWLAYSEQFFLTVTSGAVFRDDIGDLSALRGRLAYFPRDVWLCKLAAQWGRIAEERAYIGRAGDVGDEIGSRVIAARMVGNIMRLALLIERRYAPYPKWIGSAFSRLACAPDLTPLLDQVLSSEKWPEREAGMLDACRFMAELQIQREVPGAIAPSVGSLHGRPFRFIDTLKICNALRDAIDDDDLKQIADFGAPDQFISSNYVLAVPKFAEASFAAVVAATRDDE